MIIFLIVQIFGITIIGEVREYFMSFTTIALSSFISFQCTFISISLFYAFPLGGSITLLDTIALGI